PRAAPIQGTKTLDIFWDKRIREAGKMVRHSPLFPKGQRRSGKAAFNWLPTSDLQSRWPGSLFVWAIIVIGILSVVAAYAYVSADTPAPLSKSHSANVMSMNPAIAAEPIAGSCAGCHKWKGAIEQRCAQCHDTDAFVSTVIKPHEAAGVGCVDCHA